MVPFKHLPTELPPVMLTKETSINLAIFIPQCFSRPEWKSLEFSPDQRMWIALEESGTKQWETIWSNILQYFLITDIQDYFLHY